MTAIAALAAALATLCADPPADAPTATVAEATLAELVSTDRLMDTIAALPPKRAGRGTGAHHAGLAEARDLLVQRLRAMGHEPELEEVYWKPPGWDVEAQGHPPAWHNIVVDIEGVEHPEEVIIVGAHYDAVARAPGADDNATGVGAVMEMARLLQDRPMKRTVRLILFTLEEVGLVGSTQHAARYQQDVLFQDAETPLGMISLDMLGFFSDEPNSQKSPVRPIRGVFEPPTVADFIAMGGIAQHREFSQRLDREMRAGSPGLETVVVDFLPIPPPDMLRSDHAPFLAIGVPAVILSDTANFRSPHYHQPTDTIETIDEQRYTGVVRGLVHAVHAIAEPADAP